MAHSLLSIQLAAMWAVLVLAVFVSFFIHKHHFGRYLPPSGAVMLLGMACGQVFLMLGLEPNTLGFSPDAFFYGMLPPIVFSAGLGLRNRDFFRNFGTIFTFAIIGTLVSTFIFSFVTYHLFQSGFIKRTSLGRVPQDDCLMYGALVSATDTVATLSVFSDLHAPHLVYSLVFGESVLNDAIAILLFSTVEETYGTEFNARKAITMTVKFLQISTGSVFVGVGSALIFAAIFRKLQFAQVEGSPAYNGPAYEMSVMLLSAYLAYIIAEALGLSGIVALFFAGIIHNHYSMHNISFEGGQAAKDMVEVASFCSETFTFVYLGLQVPHTFHGARAGFVDWGLIISGVPLCLFARACSIFPLALIANLLRTKPISLPHLVMIWFAGLRGAVAYALSLRLRNPDDGEASGNEALEIATLSIVVVSTLIMGALTGPLMHALGLGEEPVPANGSYISAESNVGDPLFLAYGNWTWGEGASSFLMPRPNMNLPTAGFHAWWRRFDRRCLKPIFGGRREIPMPPSMVPAPAEDCLPGGLARTACASSGMGSPTSPRSP